MSHILFMCFLHSFIHWNLYYVKNQFKHRCFITNKEARYHYSTGNGSTLIVIKRPFPFHSDLTTIEAFSEQNLVYKVGVLPVHALLCSPN